ncbi:uncharacterized protein LOC121874487 [Homarus americanus]|uniref:uncharacterized protein LOC121874487 n=1 Tax=Homarus americanus TaxID=6706 RepID=UPI001C47AA6C|nr:uncharacterized protein LOC121874487 [Homarus americanus]XP_042234560.1 uncharacterized protein LOC121874487 [Homarus americanus]
MRLLTALLLTTTLLVVVVVVDGGWLEAFAEQLCTTNVRCYIRTYSCAQLLNVYNMQQSMLGVLSYCHSLLGSNTLRQVQLTSDDLFDVMNGVHGDQLPECVLAQTGLVTEGTVNQAALYLTLASTTVSVNREKQNSFLDSVSNCPAPTKNQLPAFFACVMQGCVQSI